VSKPQEKSPNSAHPSLPLRSSKLVSWARILAWSTRHELLVAFLAGLAVMWYIQSNTYEPSGRDSLYHIKMAALLPEIGFPEHFQWLRHSILNDNNVSHHTGFHIMLVPFVYASKWTADLMPAGLLVWAKKEGSGRPIRLLKTGLKGWLEQPYILGAKMLSTLMFGFVSLLIMVILRRIDVSFRWFWLIATFALPWEFYLRMSYIRAPIVSLVIMLAFCYCCMTRRYIWLGILGILSGHIYLGALVFFPFVVGSFVVAGFFTWQNHRKYTPLIAAAIVGTVIGLLTHPFFPESVNFLKIQILKSGLQVEEVNKVGVGVEWKPYEIKKFAMISGFTIALVLLSISLRATWNRLSNQSVIAFLLLNAFFLFMCLRARRFVEYWPVFALISSATFWRAFDQDVRQFLNKVSTDSEGLGSLLTLLSEKAYVLLCLVALLASGFSLSQARHVGRSPFDHEEIIAAMKYLKDHSPPGALVFSDDWDTFPAFFYYNHHNHYVCGLDPQFNNTKDPELWERYCVITQGRSPKMSKVKVRDMDNPSKKPAYKNKKFHVKLRDISDRFIADYVLVDSDHNRFYRQLTKDQDMFEYVFPLTDSKSRPLKQPSLAIFKVNRTPEVDVSRETSPTLISPD